MSDKAQLTTTVNEGEIVRLPKPVPDPMQILAAAVDGRLGADEIGKIIGLIDHLREDAARASFQRAMAACQAAMPVVVRDKVNQRTSSRYASLDTINVIAHPIYTSHGFFVSFTEEKALREGWVKTVAMVGHRDGHRERAELELPMDGIGPKGEPIGGMNKVQGVLSSNTYAEKRLLCRIFNITVADEDKDGEPTADPAKLAADAQAVYDLLPKAYPNNPGRFWHWVSTLHGVDAKGEPRTKITTAEDILACHLPTVLATLKSKAGSKGNGK